MELFDILLHLDKHLNAWIGALGMWSYVLLFLVIFCETGLVITPFLPGDSLLFAVGAMAALDGSPLNVWLLLLLLSVAAILGDAANYSIGKSAGGRLMRMRGGTLINPDHVKKTQEFYERYGGKTIVIARFVPIVRTFAPFVAGLAGMNRLRFTTFNIGGGLLWVFSLVLAGYWFGNLPIVKNNFETVVIAIVLISVMPMVVEGVRSRMARRTSSPGVS